MDKKILGILLFSTFIFCQSYFKFGDTSAPGTASVYSANTIIYNKITVTKGGALSSLYVYVIDSANVSIKGALYNSNGTAPTTVLDSTGEVSTKKGAWHTLNFLGNKTIAPGTYYIAINANAAYRRAKSSDVERNFRTEADAYGSGWPATATTGVGSNDGDVDAYISLSVNNVSFESSSGFKGF